MLHFLLSEKSAGEFLNEMPHFSLDNKEYYDLKIEDHIKDTPEEFIKYVIAACKKNKEICKYLKSDTTLKNFTTRYFGKDIYIKLIKSI